jgi:hypothetical protein
LLKPKDAPHMDPRSTGLLVIAVGVVVIVVGLLIVAGGLSWLFHLPGDIRIERDGTRIYFPITTMILLSLVLTLVSYIVRKVM